MNTQVIEFLTNTPNSNKAQITEATGIKGLPLFNLLKQMMKDGHIVSAGEGTEMTYSIAEAKTEQVVTEEQLTGEQTTKSNTVAAEMTEPKEDGEEIQEPIDTETKTDETGPKEEKQHEVKATPAKNTAGRNNGTFSFNGTSYNKGKLIQAVVSAHVAKNKNITHDKLKEVFANSLLKRFGIFQTVEKAREISGAKYDRYFFKEEFQIKLKDAVIVTCNQITAENILPFLDVCAKIGYAIEAE